MSEPVPSATDYVQPPVVVTYLDADDQVVADKSLATHGEILETQPDGSIRSTLFTLDGS
jgi:hypothetical protein